MSGVPTREEIAAAHMNLLSFRSDPSSRWAHGEIERLRAELAAAIKERDEAVELYTDLLRRLSGSTLPRHAFLSGDASEKEGGGA